MKSLYDRYWSAIRGRSRLQRALIASFIMHVAGVLAFAYAPKARTRTPIPISYAVDLVAPPRPGPIDDKPPTPAAAAPTPQVTPPEPEPEPEKPVEKKAPEKKPEPKKEQVAKKPEPKPEPKKETPPPKKPSPPKKEIVAKNEQPQSNSGVSARQELPTMLSAWARSLQRKVERFWSVPGGIKVTKDGEEALVSFWVNKDGNLIGQPEILDEGPDRALAESGVRAILAAAPFPPFPPDYKESEQEVIYGFGAMR